MFRRKAILLGIAAIVIGMLFGLRLQAQCINPDDYLYIFTSSSHTISGTVKNCELDGSCRTTRIAPVADSSTTAFYNKELATNEISLDNVYQAVYGVKVYDLSNVDNTTSTADCFGVNGHADAHIGTGSLLEGLVTWTSNDNLFTCDYFDDRGAVHCSSSQKISGLTINGVAVPVGNHRGGVSLPVSGTIKDTVCVSGTETFNGSLTLQESSIHGSGTGNLTVSLTGMHLTGQATCTTLGLVNLFTTQYDLRVSGHSDLAQMDGEEAYLKFGIHTLQFASELDQ